ncbi:MAG: recombination regulator RecX [Chlorobiaceae bacterium]|nr:recombination regulator RecX [Chlorobiaceae bacterium]
MTSQPDKLPENALALALKLLGIRSHSREELERKLRQKGFTEDIRVPVIEKLASRGLLDDREFGIELLKSRSKRKPSGKLKLGAELRKKGVPDPVIGDLLKEIDTGELCMRAAEKKFALLRSPSEAARKKKLESFLRNRGFSWQEIREAIERFFPGAADREDPD